MNTNILRPPPAEKLPRRDDENEARRNQSTVASARSSTTPILLIIGIISAIGLALIAVVGGQATAPPPTALATAPVATAPPVRETIIVTATPVPTPNCVSAQSQLALVDGLIQQGKWETAQAQAEAGLSTTGLCDTDIRPLTRRAVLAGLQGLYNQQFDPLDAAGQQRAVDQFLTLRECARLAGVEFPAPLQVARESIRISQHRLTVAAIETAFTDGAYNPAMDRETTKLYISALYGLGYWYTQAERGSGQYNEGLAYLACSHSLTVAKKTGQAEAAMLLRQLVGNDEAMWPKPYASPLLPHNP